MLRVKLLSAAWVVPVARAPIRHGRVAIDGDRIAWVGAAGEPGEPPGEVRDLGAGVLLPGLVNAHCHLELSGLAGAIPAGVGFSAWVTALVAARAAAAPAALEAAATAAIDGLAGTGTVAIGDVSNALGHLPALGRSSVDAVVFYEQIGWDPARADAIADAARDRLDALRPWLPANVEVRLAAHAPHSVSAPLFRRLVRADLGALHLAESPDESAFLRNGNGDWGAFLRSRVGEIAWNPPAVSPVAYVDGLGVLQPGLLAAHCVHVDADDRARLARSGTAVVVCPRSNRTIGVGLPPVAALRAAGVPLALGTDSLASAPSLDLAEEMAALQRELPGLEPAFIVHMATAGGARALGRPQLGTLDPGRRAALAFAPADASLRSPEAFLTSGEARVRRVSA
jgi:cytosine/adenosine deaminase-related metal-dependent hydrolase